MTTIPTLTLDKLISHNPENPLATLRAANLRGVMPHGLNSDDFSLIRMARNHSHARVLEMEAYVTPKPSALPAMYRYVVMVDGAVYSGFDSHDDAQDDAKDARATGLDAKVRAGSRNRGAADWRPSPEDPNYWSDARQEALIERGGVDDLL